MGRVTLTLAAVVAAMLAVSTVTAQTVSPVYDDTSEFRVSIPPEVAGSYPHSEALFGLPSYGGSISGVLIYATVDYNRTGCEVIHRDPHWPDNAVLLIDRGDCSFVQKVRNAELAGALAVVIADYTGLCGIGQCSDTPCDNCDWTNPDCECKMPIMADDGSGGDVNIPSFLIPRYYADRLKECILGTGQGACAHPTPVVITMEWSLPRSEGRVAWDLWTTSEDVNSADFRASISHLVEPLGPYVDFHPHFFIYDGRLWGCTTEWAGGFLCGNQCSNSGKYCSPDPDQNLDNGHSGYDVVAENLRQMCIWQQANATYMETYGWQWWNYTSKFDDLCVKSSGDWGMCSRTVQVEVGLNPVETDACVARAGGLADGSNNTMLQTEVELRTDLSIVVLPTIVINGVIERGDTSAVAVLHTICAGFKAGNEPPVCACQQADPESLKECLAAGSGSGRGDGGSGAGHGGSHGGQQNGGNPTGPGDEGGLPGWAAFLMVVLVLLVIGLGVGGFVVFKRLQKRIDAFDYQAIRADGSAPAIGEGLAARDGAAETTARWGSVDAAAGAEAPKTDAAIAGGAAPAAPAAEVGGTV